MEGLKDIQGVVAIPDHSLEILIALIIVSLMILAFGLYWFKNRRRRRKKLSPRALAKKALNELNFENTKEAVYGFLENAQPFVNEKNESLFRAIEKELTPYKYKKEVPALEATLKKKMQQFIEGAK